MYDIIYDFVLTNIFNSTYLTSFDSTIFGQTINMNQWLSHSVAIITMILFVVFLFIFGKWLFKIVSGLFLLK